MGDDATKQPRSGGPRPGARADGIVPYGRGSPKLTRVVARLTDDEFAALDAFADFHQLSMSRAVARLVRDLLMDE